MWTLFTQSDNDNNRKFLFEIEGIDLSHYWSQIVNKQGEILISQITTKSLKVNTVNTHTHTQTFELHFKDFIILFNINSKYQVYSYNLQNCTIPVEMAKKDLNGFWEVLIFKENKCLWQLYSVHKANTLQLHLT